MNSVKAEQLVKLSAANNRVTRQLDSLKSDVGVQVDELACAYQAQHEGMTYDTALNAVLADDADLNAKYVASFGQHKMKVVTVEHAAGDDDEGDAGAEIDRMASKLQRENPSWTYEKCLGRVLEENPELKKKYAANR